VICGQGARNPIQKLSVALPKGRDTKSHAEKGGGRSWAAVLDAVDQPMNKGGSVPEGGTRPIIKTAFTA